MFFYGVKNSKIIYKQALALTEEKIEKVELSHKTIFICKNIELKLTAKYLIYLKELKWSWSYPGRVGTMLFIFLV